MASEILMPKLGLTMKNGTLVKWLREEGDRVAFGEPLFEVETEKLTNTIEAMADGVILKKTAAEGEKYEVGAVLGYIGEPGESCGDEPVAAVTAAADEPDAASYAADAKDTSASEAKKPSDRRIFISPLARKLAEKHGIDISKVKGTGPNGRIVKADIENYAASAPAAATPDAPAHAPAAPAASADAVFPVMEPEEGDRILPYSGMRKAIGDNMFRAWMTVPMVTHNVTIDASAMMDLRKSLNAGVAEKEERISVNDIIMKITAAALAKMPVINSSLCDKGIIIHKKINIGMATAVDNGLLVPVVHDADKKGLLTISKECRDLAGKARSGGLDYENMDGATFTVTNLGGYGSVDSFSPIINPPQAAILGVGRAVDTVVPAEGGFAVHPMMTFSFTYDHRIIDGAAAAEFMKIFMELFTNPVRAVLD